MTSDDHLIIFLMFLSGFAFVMLSFIIGKLERFKSEAIKRGFALYNPTTGILEWKNSNEQ